MTPGKSTNVSGLVVHSFQVSVAVRLAAQPAHVSFGEIVGFDNWTLSGL
jgi:hypothetical protein